MPAVGVQDEETNLARGCEKQFVVLAEKSPVHSQGSLLIPEVPEMTVVWHGGEGGESSVGGLSDT
jgi:hypothetical protein